MEKRTKIMLGVVLLVFVAACSWNIFFVDREAWFDSSFTLETVHILRTQGYGEIDFSQYDVHSPVYYTTLYWWSYLHPGYLNSPATGITEYHWAQMLSMVYGIIFFIFVFLGMSKVFGTKGEIATLLLTVCTAYVHYFTEPRMYGLVLALSSIVFYAMINKFEGKWFWIAAVALFILPFAHYFASMAVFVYPFIGYFVLRKFGVENKVALKRVISLFVIGLIAIVLVASLFALPQKSRTQGTWFKPPNITSWPSAAFYSFFMTEGFQPSFWMSMIYVCFLGGLVWMAWTGFNWVGKKMTKEKTVMLFMAMTAMLPAIGLIGAPLLGGEGFAHLYHHRFFLVVIWMFAITTFLGITTFLLSKKRVVQVIGFTVVAVSLLFMLSFYGQNAHHELHTLVDGTPCKEVQILHESPFSALPFTVYGREYGCPWINIVSTNMSKRMLNGGGGDAMNQLKVFYNRGLPETGDYYYVYAAATIPIDGNATLAVEEDGVELMFIKRTSVVHPKSEGWLYRTHYNNVTEFMEIEWYKENASEVVVKFQ